jgi:hypothetical protein
MYHILDTGDQESSIEMMATAEWVTSEIDGVDDIYGITYDDTDDVEVYIVFAGDETVEADVSEYPDIEYIQEHEPGDPEPFEK